MANLFMNGPGDSISAFAGFSGTLVATIAGPAGGSGVAIEKVGPDGKNHVISGTSGNFYRHDAGFSATILDTFTHFGAFYRDLGFDGSGNLQVPTVLFNTYTKYVGITSTVFATFNTSAGAGGFIDEETSTGDNFSSLYFSGVPTFVLFDGFSSSVLSSFSNFFDLFITGGKCIVNSPTDENLLGVRYNSLFGGIQVVTVFDEFSSTVAAQISSPVYPDSRGAEFFVDTYDFGVRVNITASPNVVVEIGKPLNLRIVQILQALNEIVFGGTGTITRLPPVTVGCVEAVATLKAKVAAAAGLEPRVEAGARLAPKVAAEVALEPRVEAEARLAPKVAASAKLCSTG